MRGHLAEGRQRLARILAMPEWPAAASRSRLRALEAAGGLAYWGGDIAAAGPLYGDAVVEARRLGDDAEIANAAYNQTCSTALGAQNAAMGRCSPMTTGRCSTRPSTSGHPAR